MEQATITIKRIGGYVVVISLLLLGSVMCVWWVLSGQLASRTYDTQSLVSYTGSDTGLETRELNLSQSSYTITSQDIVNATIQSQDIASATITKDKLHPSAVVWLSDLLSNNVTTLNATLQQVLQNVPVELLDVTSLQIVDGTITLNDLESSVVDAIQLTEVADNSITSLKIADGALSTVDIASSAINSGLIADGSVGTADIVAGAIDSSLLAANAVTSTIIVDGIIATTDIAAGAITSTLIQDGTISTADLLAGSIDGGLLANNAVSQAHIVNGAVTGLKILDGTIAAADIAQGVITGDLITDGSIALADISAGAIGTTQLLDSAVTSLKINDGTIAAVDIAVGAIGTVQLSNGAVQVGKLSTASSKRTVSVQIGDVSIVLGDIERPVFVAPTNGTITKITFTNALSITAGLNKGVMSVERKTATVATVASVDLGSVSLSGFVPQSPALGSGTTFSTGDVYSFKWDAGLVGVALTGFLVTIEYVPSE